METGIALSALDCFLDGRKAVYASSDLTTGQRLYQLLREYGLRTNDELRERLGDDEYRKRLLEPNAAAAKAFADRLRDRLSGALVINPGPFVAAGWSQREYLAFWETVIRTRVTAVIFNDGWQYSNGCTFEFAVAQDRGLATRDASGDPLDLVSAIRLVGDAIRVLDAESFDTTGLRDSVARLHRIRR